LGQDAVALTDDGALHGAIRFYDECKKENVKPIVGVQVNFVEEVAHREPGTSNLILLAKNREGYSNICKLVSESHDEENFYYKPRVDLKMLEKYHRDVICTVGGWGNPMHDAWSKDLPEYHDFILNKIHGIFTMDFYPQITPYDDEKYQEWARHMIGKFPIQYFVTNHVRYLTAEDYKYYDLIWCINRKAKYEDHNRKRPDDSLFMRSEEELRALDFGLTEKQVDLGIGFAKDVVEEVDLTFEKKFFFPKAHIPRGLDNDEYFRQLLKKAFLEKSNLLKYATTAEYKERLKYEVGAIINLGYVDYFLVVSDFVKKEKENGVLIGPGRGSAAGCLVSYLLDITEVDPLRYGLIFERFLDPTGQRVSPPDIDIDFQDSERDDVIRRLVASYGEDHVAAVGNITTLAFKSSIKDVAKCLGIPFEVINSQTKFISAKMNSKKDLLKNRQFKQLYNTNEDFAKSLDLAEGVKGTMRQLSTHAAGIVVSPEPIRNFSPTQRVRSAAKKGIISPVLTCQLDKEDVENLGLLKIDILGLTTLTTIKRCLKLIKDRTGTDVNIKEIDFDDPKVYDVINKGLTAGVFQIEGKGITELGMQLGPEKLMDVSDLIALYRPAVLGQDLDKFYLKNKNRAEGEPIKVIQESLRTMLEPTQGILLYQEQLMQATRTMADFTLAEADTLRRAIGKKKISVLQGLRTKFEKGCLANGLTMTDVDEVWSIFEDATQYGFNAAHSCAYAHITCQTSYLKRYHTLEYMCALFQSEGKKLRDIMKDRQIEKIEHYAEECRTLGIDIKPPHVNESEVDFSIGDGRELVYGLGVIKEVGQGFAAQFISLRESCKDKKFTSFEQFLNLAADEKILVPNKVKLVALISAGIFDCFNPNRHALQDELEEAVKVARDDNRKNKADKVALIPMFIEDNSNARTIKDFTFRAKRTFERDYLGIVFS
jgi:DNA polymerase-3 subunit alpha